MKHLKSRLLAAGLGLVFLAGLTDSQAADQQDKEKKEKKGNAKVQPAVKPPNRGTQPGAGGNPDKNRGGDADNKRDDSNKNKGDNDGNKGGNPAKNQDGETGKKGDNPKNNPGDGRQGAKREDVKLSELKKADGSIERKAPSGKVREKIEKKPDGEHTEHFSPTGRKQSEEIQKADGSKHTTDYDLGGKVKREEVARPDGGKEVTNHQMDRDGGLRGKETVKYDSHDHTKIVSKTVTKTVNKTVIVNNYDRGRYGYVYRPGYIGRPRVFVSWYDPYWYTPAGVVVFHPFRFSWGWGSYGWYRSYHGSYWVNYDVYPSPSYWVTDWLVADYVSDHYAASVSAARAQEEARLAREEAVQARQAAEAARDAAEIAEAKAAQAQAELRARNAEERAARAEREEARAGKPNPNATPIDKDTKEALKNQIEKTIAEKKEFAEQSEKGGKPMLPDVSKALADSKHIYPVSKTISVVSAKDSAAAGMVSEGDLLKLEPGQETTLKDATENTMVTMRVMTSKGEEGEVAAGTLISVALKDLQEFDSEFQAKLDEGLTEADKKKDLFKQGAQ